MKYGYLLYQKPLIPEMPSRPVNLGDPIQSYAVKLLYREMGIAEEDIIPVPRYDLRNYDGEECICTINTCTTYEELAYDSEFMPPSKKIHPLVTSIHLHRDIPEDELEFYRSCPSVGCRDEATARNLAALGIRTYLSGCLTITLPRRTEEQSAKANTVYLIDVQKEFRNIIPDSIKSEAVELSSIHRFKITHGSNRMTTEEALGFHRLGEERVALLRDTAKLVITSRLHAAAPCLAMGIPVILTKHDDRFGFIDRFVTSCTDWHADKINWSPGPVEMEREKTIIKRDFFNRVRAMESAIELQKMWESKKPLSTFAYEPQSVSAIENVNFRSADFKYAILGVISNAAYYVVADIRKKYPEAKLVCGIDSFVKRDFCGVKVITPAEIAGLPKDVIVITSVPAAFESAKPFLSDRPLIFIKGKNAECQNF